MLTRLQERTRARWKASPLSRRSVEARPSRKAAQPEASPHRALPRLARLTTRLQKRTREGGARRPHRAAVGSQHALPVAARFPLYFAQPHVDFHFFGRCFHVAARFPLYFAQPLWDKVVAPSSANDEGAPPSLVTASLKRDRGAGHRIAAQSPPQCQLSWQTPYSRFRPS